MGGSLISDIVLRRPLPADVVQVMGLWTGCVSGALLHADYAEELASAGFGEVSIEPTHVYDRADLTAMAGDLSSLGAIPASMDLQETLDLLDGAIMSAFVRARKPAEGAIGA